MSKCKNNKNLSELEICNIEFYLNENKSPAAIGRILSRDPTTIRKEIKKFSTFCGHGRKCSLCANRRDCHVHYLCSPIEDRVSCASCRHCKKAAKICPYFKRLIDCERLDKKHICNGCENVRTCNITYRYIGKYAIMQHKALQNVSHTPLKFDSFPEDFKAYLGKKIKDGISPEVILNTLPEEYSSYKISVPTLYDYIDLGLLDCCNLDLRTKVSRRALGSQSFKRNTVKGHQLNGRSIENLDESDKSSPLGVIEIDTVEGIKGGAVLFTMMIPKYSLMLAYKLKSRSQEEVKRVLDYLEYLLGDDFYIIFRCVIPDNGSEFVNYEYIENSIYSGMKRCKVYYTHTYSAYEKPHVENNHILLRWLIKKGYDISKISEEQILIIIEKLNNYPRPNKDFRTPLELLEEDFGPQILEKLNLKKIPIEDLVMRMNLPK